jgi:Rrf2 family protein
VIFTTKAEYGVRLLVELGKQDAGVPVSLKSIAESEGLPLAYLERIVALLKKSGFVESTRGAHGGYRLAQSAEDIRMDAVIAALEGGVAPMSCFVDDIADQDARVPSTRVLCSHHDDGELCATKLLWTRVQGGVIRALQNTTLAELVAFTQRESPLTLTHS